MDLFVIRHAEAAPGRDDRSRRLTPRGHAQCRRLTLALEGLGVEVAVLLHSPWVRAVETADALKPISRGDAIATQLLAQPPSRALLAQLAGRTCAVVGHEPWVSQLLAWLVLADPAQAEHFPMKKSGVAWLEGEPAPGKMVLRALLPPRVLKRLG
jgi:phosphohistidine phosphatase